MLFTTPEHFIVLAALLLGGLLIGYAIAPSPHKWQRRVREQSHRFTQYYRKAEQRLRTADTRAAAAQAEADALRADHAALERTIAELRAAAAAVASTPPASAPPPPPEAEASVHEGPITEPAAPVAEAHHPVAAGPATDAAPARTEMPGKGWFAGSARNDLTRLHGIDGVLDARLFALGVTRFEDIEKLSAEDEMALEQRLSLPAGYILRERWRAQATRLRAGADEHHAEHETHLGHLAPPERLPST